MNEPRRSFAWSFHIALVAAAVLPPLTSCQPKESPGPGNQPKPPPTQEPTGWESLPPVRHPDPELAPLPQRTAAHTQLCAKGRKDSFAVAMCNNGAGRPDIRSLGELIKLAGLAEQSAFALTANSTSLVAKSVSAINPRILVFPRVGADLKRPEKMTALGFVRGEQFVEIVSRDLATGDLNFYLVSFEQRCSYETAGCDLASLLTEEVERDWTAYSVYDHDDLERTSFDCLSCHQPGGRGTKRMLRMQELESPWLHWFPQRFVQHTESDRVLGAQFAQAHQHDTQYGGIPISVILNALDEGSGAQLEALVRAEGFADQPNPFDGRITAELKAGASTTWQTRYDAHLRGEAIAVPHPALDVTDEAKRNAAVRSYQDVVRKVAPRQTLLDIREVFSNEAMERLSFVPKPGADGKTVLTQMCARCHDGRGNPELPKNRFNVRKLGEMSRASKDAAIARLTTDSAQLRMPPWRVGTLTAASVQAATAELLK